MPCSMTGFARQEARLPWGTLAWELRSVNHRYLELFLRLPDTQRSLEQPLRDRIRNHLSRGKLEATLQIQLADNLVDELSLDLDLVQKLSCAIEQVKGLVTDAAPINTLEILKWPGVLKTEELDSEVIQTEALKLFDQALEQLLDYRQREGQQLQQHLEQRLSAIQEQVNQVRNITPDILTAQREKIVARLEAIKADLDKDRLEQEMVYLAQKADVTEELDRLETHVHEVHRTLKQQGAMGRRLDFLMQELNREANTLSSKSLAADSTQIAVELKVLVEQMREQVQNIE